MRRREVRPAIGAPAVMAALAAAALLPPGAGAGARAARECAPPSYPGAGYFTSLTVKQTTCRTGRQLALAYYRCRIENGKAGRCDRKVMRYSCTEERNSIPTELDARVRCKRGDRRIVHTYQQNL